MRSNDAAAVTALHAALDALADQDPATRAAATARRDLRELLAATARLHAEVARRVATFDANRWCLADGYRTTRGWLKVFGRLTHSGATRLVRAARLLRELPRLADAAARGDVSAEHIHQIDRLTARVGLDAVRMRDRPLAEFARWVDASTLARACLKVRGEVGPDRTGPGSRAEHARCGVTLTRVDGMLALRGRLDPRGGAVLRTAIEAFADPPPAGDDRRPAQVRADALVALARAALDAGRSSGVGRDRRPAGTATTDGLITPEEIPAPPEDLPPPQDTPGQGEDLVGRGRPGWRGGPGRTGARSGRRPPARPRTTRSEPSAPSAAGSAAQPPSQLAAGRVVPGLPSSRTERSAGVYPVWPRAREGRAATVPGVGGRRLDCGTDVRRVELDPATGRLRDTGGVDRVLPTWLRKALHARDRGCAFPGCAVAPVWTDAHQLGPSAPGGGSGLDHLVLLCRAHHCLVHADGWDIGRDAHTGAVVVRRPDGRRFTRLDPPWA